MLVDLQLATGARHAPDPELVGSARTGDQQGLPIGRHADQVEFIVDIGCICRLPAFTFLGEDRVAPGLRIPVAACDGAAGCIEDPGIGVRRAGIDHPALAARDVDFEQRQLISAVAPPARDPRSDLGLIRGAGEAPGRHHDGAGRLRVQPFQIRARDQFAIGVLHEERTGLAAC
jgi:hypothetical protein